MDRSCGGCTFCCYLVEVPELKKKINEWCTHCDRGRSCNIYDERPPSCRKFECGWLQDPSVSDSLRPDRCGVMIEKLKGYSICLALCSPEKPYEWRKPEVIDLLRSYVLVGTAVLVGTGKGKPDQMMIPKGRMAGDVMNDVRAFALKTLKR